MNVAQPYGGYTLNDIANALGIYSEYTIDYTKHLPKEKGFVSVDFDALPDYFDTVGVEHRGYILETSKVAINEVLEEVSKVNNLDGTVVYNCNPKEQFSAFTNICKPLEQEAFLLGSLEFAEAAKLKDGERVSYTIDKVTFNRMFKIDTSMEGFIALNPTFDMELSTPLVSSYRFSRVEIKKIGS